MNYIKIPAFLKVWLFTLLGLFSLTSLQAQCEASYVFSFVDAHTAVFFNNSENYNGQEWELEDGTSLADGPSVMTYTFDSDTNRVCLRVWTNDGCEDTQCLNVYPGAPEEMCNTTDCVWPGDANDDFKANNYDVLSLAMGFGNVGPARPFFPDPENPMAWAPNFSMDWPSTTGNVNDKHLDCDGNGVIDENDLEAISLNYQPEFGYASTATAGAPNIEFDFQVDSIYYYNVSHLDSFEIKANLVLGSEEVPFDNLYGLAFDFTYPDELVGTDAISIEYDTNAFLGAASDVIVFGEDINSLGRYDVALCRKDGIDVNGNGTIGTVTFIINSDIIGGLSDPHIPFSLFLERFKLIDAEGNELEYDLTAPIATAVIIRDIVAEESKINPENPVQVYPNPVTDQLIIDLGDLNGNTLEIYNLLGQPMKKNVLKGQIATVDVNDIPPGIYLLRINTSDGIIIKQIHVE